MTMSKKTIKIAGGLLVLALLLLGLKNYLLPAPEPIAMLQGKSYSVADSTLGELIDHPDTVVLLDKYLPGIRDIRQLTVARPLYLSDLASFYPSLITENKMNQLDVALKTVKPSTVILYTTGSTVVGTILDDEDARAIVDKHLPGFSTNPQIDQGRGFTLNFMQKFDREAISDDVLAAINADFEQLANTRAGR